MYTEEILKEIDKTLDQLIHNAETLQGVDLSDLSEPELDAFEKTQESLLHHLLHMDQSLETKRLDMRFHSKKSVAYKIQEKTMRFEKLKTEINNTIQKLEKTTPILGKRRSKRFLRTR